ncbi:MAG: permease-like cell division protein FtsX [Acidimicrobiia bacterium]|jgi:cell division transport system permease protein|nr:permease-like cell division protein FtsX [Acidimicrobiia bacterium]MBP8180404.1 permease-like cell division protein FtsX [Acidimicrobiia bacterium]
MFTNSRYFLRETLVSLRRNLLMTVAGVLTVFVSLFLLGGVLVLSTWVGNGTQRWTQDFELDIFMMPDATDAQVAAIETDLNKSDLIKRVVYYDQTESFELFQEMFKDQPELLVNITPSDLPPSFRVVPSDPETTTQIAQSFRGRPGVYEVTTAEDVVDSILRVTGFIRFGFMLISLVLLASSLFLIVNTIRLATFARRREIQVMKLVGATNWFVRVPFMLEGMVQGFIGAFVAVLGVIVLKLSVFDRIEGGSLTSGFYVTNGEIFAIGLLIIFVGIIVGAVGSFIGLRRFIEV